MLFLVAGVRGGVQGDKDQDAYQRDLCAQSEKAVVGSEIPTLPNTWLLDAIVVVERVLTNTRASAHWTLRSYRRL